MIALSSSAGREARKLGGRNIVRLLDEARSKLESSELFRGRSGSIRIEERDGKLILEGRLPSFYLKQMLQTILREVDGFESIENRVAVDWPPSN